MWLLCCAGLVHAQSVARPSKCEPRGVETSILIQGSAQEVWDELTAFGNYPAWHPYLKSATGILRRGKYLHFVTLDSAKGEGKFSAKVLDLQPAKSLEWGGSALFFFRAKHYFHLVQNADGTCLLVQGEYWKGLFGKGFGKRHHQGLCGKFEEMNERLRKRVEG